MLQSLYCWTPYVPSLFGVSCWLSKRLSRIKFFRIIHFWQEHKGEFDFSKDGYAVLKEIQIEYKMELAYDFFERYFELKKKQKIYKKNGKLFVKIEGLVFHVSSLDVLITLTEIFEEKCYNFFDLKNKTVLDIGGFVGDSAIFFAWKGAKKVVTYEANPQMCELAEQNIKLNNLTEKIKVRQKAVAKTCGFQFFNFRQDHPTMSSVSSTAKNANHCKVATVSLSSIINELGHVDVLKIDCEGSEHDLLHIAYDESALNNVDSIMMEVHGPLQPIVDILQKADFKILKNSKIGSNVSLLCAQRNKN
jgi:FkbM family methyltransferase